MKRRSHNPHIWLVKFTKLPTHDRIDSVWCLGMGTNCGIYWSLTNHYRSPELLGTKEAMELEAQLEKFDEKEPRSMVTEALLRGFAGVLTRDSRGRERHQSAPFRSGVHRPLVFVNVDVVPTDDKKQEEEEEEPELTIPIFTLSFQN